MKGDGSAHRTKQLVIADAEDVAVLDGFALNALARKFDAIRRTHVDHVEISPGEFDQGVLARNVRIADRKIRGRLPSSDDEAILGYLKRLSLVVDGQLLGDG